MISVSVIEIINKVRREKIGRTKYCVIKMEGKFYLQNY